MLSKNEDEEANLARLNSLTSPEILEVIEPFLNNETTVSNKYRRQEIDISKRFRNVLFMGCCSWGCWPPMYKFQVINIDISMYGINFINFRNLLVILYLMDFLAFL